MSSCQKFVRLIRNITLESCTVCEKQNQKSARNYGTIIACFWFFDQILHRNHAPATVFAELVLLLSFSVTKTEKVHERTEVYHHWGDKDCIDTKAQWYAIKRISETLRGVEIALAKVYNYISGGLHWTGQNGYWGINHYFREKLKVTFFVNLICNYNNLCLCIVWFGYNWWSLSTRGIIKNPIQDDWLK